MTDNTKFSETTAYECQACGWIYASEQDKTLVPFSSLQESFSCPLCGVDKSEFKAIKTETIDAIASQSKSQPIVDTDITNVTSEQGNTSKEDAAPRSHNIVIIGAGLAGWGVVDAIRAQDDSIDITLITADNGDRYHKPMLSAAFSQNKSSNDLIRFTAKEASKTANVNLLAQTEVHHIDSQNQMVQTDKGTIHYASLVMATGATPAMPPSLANVADDKIWHINDITNFAKMQQTLAGKTRHIAVVGAGMVGTEIAEDLTKAGHKVTLLDMNDAPLATMLPPIATTKIVEALNHQGIEFLGGSRVTKVTDINEQCKTDSKGFILHFTDASNDKKTLTVDHILVSTGLRVEDSLALSAGVDFKANTGIVVDEASLQTSVSNIYAIGDCMSIGGVACRYVAPLRAQAATIANHILGNKTDSYHHKPYEHKPPMIRLKNKSISISATGTPTSDEANGKWQTLSETQTKTHHEMILEQVTNNDETVATLTLKMPT